MDLYISVADGGPAELESLDEWLRGERELAGRIALSGPPPRQGELGTVSDLLVVALGSGGTVTVVGAALCGALKAWLSHPRRSEVIIKIHRADSSYVEIRAKDLQMGQVDIAAAFRQVVDFGTGHEPGSVTVGE